MKKDVYIIIGILALVIAGFAIGFKFYSNKSPQDMVQANSTDDTSPAPLKVDMATLVGDGAHSKGPIMAKVVVVEFLDPECEACRAMNPRAKKVLSEFDGQIRFVVRYMTYHRNSLHAIRALHAANMQGKYWEFLDFLFEKQKDWGEKQEDQSPQLLNYAKDFGFDMNKFKKDFEGPEGEARAVKDDKDGKSIGVMGTPSFYVNGVLVPELGEAPLRNAIQTALSENQ